MSYFFRPSGSGKEGTIVVTMDGKVEDIGIVIEDLLGPVTMVNVLMGDENELSFETDVSSSSTLNFLTQSTIITFLLLETIAFAAKATLLK